MYPGKIRVRLIPKEAVHLPRGARRVCSIKFDHAAPVPVCIRIPLGGIYSTFKRRFAVIKGGESPEILEVIYVEKNDD